MYNHAIHSIKFGLSGLAIGFFIPHASNKPKQVTATYAISAGINAYNMASEMHEDFLYCLHLNLFNPFYALVYAAGIVAGEALQTTLCGNHEQNGISIHP